MYLTYDDYIQMGGEKLEETAFENLEFEARSQVDWWTFGRLQKMKTLPEAVKRCMFKLITLIDKQQKVLMVDAVDEDGNVVAGLMAHQSNDGVSISYNVLSASEIYAAKKAETQELMGKYLQGVTNSLGQELTFRGMYLNE